MWIVFCAVAVTSGAAANGEPRADRRGDPLPTGAIGRFGSARLRHGDAVRCLAFSPDSKLLASGGAGKDGTIRIWDVASGREIRRIPSGQGSVGSVCFSPDGRVLASGGGRGAALRLWNILTGELIRQVRVSPQWAIVNSVTYSPDGAMLATGNSNSVISLWDLKTAHETARLESPGDGGTSPRFAPDGKTLLSWSAFSRTIRIWDVQAAERAFEIPRKDVSSAAVFAPDGRSFAAGCTDGTIRVWSAAMQNEVGELNGHTDAVTAVAYLPGGKRLVSSSRDKSIRIWDLATHSELRRIDVGDLSPQVVPSPDGRTLAVRFKERSGIHLWDVAEAAKTLGVDDDRPWDHIAVSMDGDRVAASRFRRLEVWDVATRKLGNALETDMGADEIAFSRDGASISARCVRGFSMDHFESTVRSWNTATGEDALRIRGDRRGGSLSPDGETLATWGYLKPIQLRHLAGDEVLDLAATAPAWKLASAYSANGKRFAVAFPSGEIRFWKVATGEPEDTLHAELDHIDTIALSTDGALLACATAGQANKTPPAVKLFDVGKGQPLRTIGTHEVPVRLLAFSPDSRLLATAGSDRLIRLWNLADGIEVAKFQDVGNTPVSLAFTPDGRSVITGMSGGDAYIWAIPNR